MKVLVLLANGFEEVEAITQVDFLRRAGITVVTAAIGNDVMVTGTFNVPVKADALLSEINREDFDMVVLPGGLKGMENLNASTEVKELVMEYNDKNKWLAAICASPKVLGGLGLLNNKKVICYPGFEASLTGATIVNEDVVLDGKIITSRGPGTSAKFALKLIEILCGIEKSIEVGTKTLIYK